MKLGSSTLAGIALAILPSPAGALTLDVGGPWTVDEGGAIVLSPEVSDAVGEVVYAWDLDGDGQYDDASDPETLFSAAGLDGPTHMTVGLVVADDDEEIAEGVVVIVTNAPPVFLPDEAPGPARVGHPWEQRMQIADPGGDPAFLWVDETDLPAGMQLDAEARTLQWTPPALAAEEGDPRGTYVVAITAEDDDNGRSRRLLTVVVLPNTPPPTPVLRHPTGDELVSTAKPDILLDAVEDADGHAVTYFIETDHDLCFCSDEHMMSGPLAGGARLIEWALPHAFNVDLGAGGHDTFYLRWKADDGYEQSALGLASWTYGQDAGGDGDADGDADGDVDGDGDADRDDGGTARYGCGCGVAGRGSALGALPALGLLFLTRRRRR